LPASASESMTRLLGRCETAFRFVEFRPFVGRFRPFVVRLVTFVAVGRSGGSEVVAPLNDGHLAAGAHRPLDDRSLVDAELLAGDITADVGSRSDLDRSAAGRHVAVHGRPPLDGDRLACTEAAEQFAVLADGDRFGAEVAVEPAVVADTGGRRDAPGVVADGGVFRNHDRLLVVTL